MANLAKFRVQKGHFSVPKSHSINGKLHPCVKVSRTLDTCLFNMENALKCTEWLKT